MTVSTYEDGNGRGDAKRVNQPTDLELMIAVQHGEVGQMGTLFERHHTRIYNFCHRMTGSQAASEDLVQEAFMRALKYRQSFRGDADFLPWLYRLARNVCNDYFQKNKRFPVTVDELPDEVSDDPSALDNAEHREQVCLLRQALLRLPVERREVLILSRFEFRNYEEIARLLGCSVGAVKVRVHRAMNQLRETYREMLKENES
jgi:RNA polymerase sigma-70 factor (ECF subfamily)